MAFFHLVFKKDSLLCLIIFCFLLHVRSSQSRSPWSTICPREKCEEIALNKVIKTSQEFFLKNNEGRIFCLKPLVRHSLKGLRYLWSNYRVTIASTSAPGSTLIYGNSTNSVLSKLQGGGTSWLRGESKARETEMRFSPYEVNCVGVKLLAGSSRGEVTVLFSQSFQIGFLIFCIIGIVLFKTASYLTKNITFYYSGGIAVGIVASLLVLLYIFSKFVPKKNLLGIGLLLSGYSFAGYIIHWIYSQGLEFAKENWTFLLIYIITAGLISFAVLYRIGPAHPRSLQLIQWSMQLIGLGLVFLSFMQFYEIGILAVVLILFLHNAPISLTHKLWNIIVRPFARLFTSRQKRKLLTLKEYQEQGEVETEKALQDLRKYCRSDPDFWERRLENLNSQTKFLEFISGKDHINETERDRHETQFPSAYDDDDDDHNTSSSSSSSSTSSPNISSHNVSSRNTSSPNSSSPSSPRYYYNNNNNSYY